MIDDDDAKYHWKYDYVLMMLWPLSLVMPPLAALQGMQRGKRGQKQGTQFCRVTIIFVNFRIRVVGILENGIGVKLKLWLLQIWN